MQEASAAEAGEQELFYTPRMAAVQTHDISDEVSVDPDHIRHPPVAAVFDDDRHPCLTCRKIGYEYEVATPLM